MVLVANLGYQVTGTAVCGEVDMRRREFVTLIGGTAWPFAARAQQTADKMRRVGILSANFEEDPLGKRAVATFLARLQQLGWAEGRNLQVTVRFAGPDIERMRIAAREIVGLQPDLILAPVTPLVLAVARETSSIPIVFTAASDPTATGLVTNLAHPGGNITGFTALESTMGGKWLQMISEIAPHVARAGLLFNIAMAPNHPSLCGRSRPWHHRPRSRLPLCRLAICRIWNARLGSGRLAQMWLWS
jgi:putative tryptophan/tyrosine transport system substrate-binding protein